MEGITSVDYRHVKRVHKEFKSKNLGDYHNLYVESDTLLLAVCLKTLETSVLKYMSLI